MTPGSPRVIAIDDEPAHLAVLANSLNRWGVPCFQIPFTEHMAVTEDMADIEPCPHVRVIFADLHLGGGALAGDHSTDFSTIGALLEDLIKPSLPYLILLWTMYPDQAPGLRTFLAQRLRGVTVPAAVVPLAKADYLDAAGGVRNEAALMKDIAAGTVTLPEAAALFKPETAPELVEPCRLTREEIAGRLSRLFAEAERPGADDVPPEFPTRTTALDDWLDAELPDFGQTPRQMLDSGDEGTLLLLDRFVNAIATSRALSHPHVVRAIVRGRLERRFREAPASDPLIREMQSDHPDDDLEDRFERWLDSPNPMFEDESPRRFFDAREVDTARLLEISGLLDSFDDGTFA